MPVSRRFAGTVAEDNLTQVGAAAESCWGGGEGCGCMIEGRRPKLNEWLWGHGPMRGQQLKAPFFFGQQGRFGQNDFGGPRGLREGGQIPPGFRITI